ncbi:hypothetical protein SAMN05216446_1598 [Parafannyhessea umbonata]|uniref:Uncharacterized protein n=1 Tax=Parafannyhessea umbonata TaxID=604330 RepID=A0A1H9QWP0_9ACTN|nr:hypothetical protein SAMN05216447_102282 [Parafannyhessea umbonata]SER64866.1 hypothetical protein SAMN05216446_1598 [Parafannyhessea umbonata]
MTQAMQQTRTRMGKPFCMSTGVCPSGCSR